MAKKVVRAKPKKKRVKKSEQDYGDFNVLGIHFRGFWHRGRYYPLPKEKP